MRKAFTLIEMIVVVGIIGILAGIMLTSFGGGTESARAAKCLSNMRSLAQGAAAFSMKSESGLLPYAGSFAGHEEDNYEIYYPECRGWISWLSMHNEYNPKPKQPIQCANISACCDVETKAYFAITNGALWKYVGRNFSVYVCPEHERLAKKLTKRSDVKIRYSYAMNAYFNFDVKPGSFLDQKSRSMTSIRADRTLLFAELPFGVAGSSYDTANSGASGDKAYSAADDTVALDCVLQCKASNNGKDYNKHWSGESEAIAFNHKSGKKWCAHVVFADGHTEKLLLPSSGGMSAEVLTALLCSGVAVSFNGAGYSMPDDADKNAEAW